MPERIKVQWATQKKPGRPEELVIDCPRCDTGRLVRDQYMDPCPTSEVDPETGNVKPSLTCDTCSLDPDTGRPSWNIYVQRS